MSESDTGFLPEIQELDEVNFLNTLSDGVVAITIINDSVEFEVSEHVFDIMHDHGFEVAKLEYIEQGDEWGTTRGITITARRRQRREDDDD